MLLKEIIAVFSENHARITLFGQDAELLVIKGLIKLGIAVDWIRQREELIRLHDS
jgi:hypothetical protein